MRQRGILAMHPFGLSVASLAFFAVAVAACGPKYPKCSKDEHCADKGEVCVDGTCQQCRDDAQCAAGQRCQGGRCEAKPECTTDGDCTNNQVCRSGRCQTECTQDGDCGSGMKCMNSRCKDKLACIGPNDCDAGFECKSGRCSAIEVSRQMCMIPTVYFDFNEATLTSATKKGLAEAIECIKAKGSVVTIEGHCDERGTEEYNLALGDRRARAVEKYLTTLGVPNAKLRALSKGEVEPADPGHDEGAWSKNRRAEFRE